MSDEQQLSPEAARNRRIWDAQSAEYQATHGPQLAASGGMAWGVWQLPESELRVLGRGDPARACERRGDAVRGCVVDVVFCDHGAMAFADPHLTVPEVARLLRPGGLLAFSMNTPILDLAWPLGTDHPGQQLVLDYWDLHGFEVPGEPVEYQLPYGSWIALFRKSGLIVEDLIELRPPADATSSYRDERDLAWARRWPMEHIWRARRAAVHA